jgi:hypothetical protein
MTNQDNQRQAVLYAYLAGIIDGEGTIRIGSSRHKDWNIKYYASIGVGMTDETVINLFVETFGSKKRIERVPDRRPIYRWGTSGNIKVPSILQKLISYLIVKRKQAELVIKFCDERQIKGFRRNKGLPKKELRRREELYRKIRKLNAVGAAATTNRKDTREREVIV